MKILKKHCKLGELDFYVAVDREITATVFDEFPEQLERFLKMGDISSEKDSDAVIELAKNGLLKDALCISKDMEDTTKFALPLLLKKADCEVSAEEILAIVEENELDEFYSAIWSFVMQGFTIGESEKKKAKIAFSMK